LLGVSKLTHKYILRLKVTCSRVLDLPDSPRKIALGAALGTALDFLPVPFISIPISFVLAKLARVNAAAAVLTVIFFKWAVPFFFTFNYFVGKTLLNITDPPALTLDFSPAGPGMWIQWLKLLGYPFILGASLNSVAAGMIAYFSVKALLDYRQRKRKPGGFKPRL
jgi:uncharacterized protein (DUF2062 family)